MGFSTAVLSRSGIPLAGTDLADLIDALDTSRSGEWSPAAAARRLSVPLSFVEGHFAGMSAD